MGIDTLFIHSGTNNTLQDLFNGLDLPRNVARAFTEFAGKLILDVEKQFEACCPRIWLKKEI